MAKLSAHGNIVLDRFTMDSVKYVLRSDDKILRKIGGGGYSICPHIVKWTDFKTACKMHAKVKGLHFIDGK